ADHRRIGDPVLEPDLEDPTMGEVHLNLGAEPPLRTDRKHVPDNQHPDHENRIDRRPACVGVIASKLSVYPAQIEHGIDLPDQMIRGHYLVEIERVKELTLPTLSPTHHRPLPRIAPGSTEHGSSVVSTSVLQHIPPRSCRESG